MDIDSFSAVREARWVRLKQLSEQRRLTGAEADELTRLYQATSGDLSAVRSAAPEPSLVTRLSLLLATSRVWLTGSHEVSMRDVRRFFTLGLAAAMYRVRWWSVWSSVIFVVLATVSAWWLVNNPDALDAGVGPPEARAQIAQFEFENYYVEYDSATFAAQVWTNNGYIAMQSIALGITGFFPAFVLYQNAISVGVVAAVMAEANMLDIFFQLIIPHGLLELTAVLVAIGTGVRLFWTMLVPGARTRVQAVAQEGRAAIGVVLGLVITLFLSGLIEGFVTGSSLPWPVKIVIGSIAFTAFWVYMFVVGRYAVAQGATGDSEGDFAVDSAPVAA